MIPMAPGGAAVVALEYPWAEERCTRRAVALAERLTDGGIAVGCMFFAFLATNLDALPGGLDTFLSVRVTVRNALLLGIFVLAWREIFTAFGLYEPRRRAPAEELGRAAAACTVASVLVLAFPPLSASGAFDYATAATFYVTALSATVGYRRAAQAVRRHGPAARERQLLVIGSGRRARRLHDRFAATRAPCRIIGFVDDLPAADARPLPATLGPFAALESVLMNVVVDEVVIALPLKSHYDTIQRAIGVCESAGIPVSCLGDVFECSLGRVEIENDGIPLLRVDAVPRGYALWAKRGIDIVGAAVALIVVAPVLLAAAAAVRLSGPGPVIYRQVRYGQGRRRFTMYKFRTMLADAEATQNALEELNEATGPVFKIRNDPRVTRLGAWLRHTSIDELPQLWNVLRGEMSLVGPRPLPVRDVSRFTEASLIRRFSVRPGITGLWQVSGRSALGFESWVALDMKYIDRWSLVLDLEILARTIPAVLRGTGAS